jgi:hypothetical protein
MKLMYLHNAEIKYRGEVGKEGGPPIYPVSPPVPSFGDRLIRAGRRPLDAEKTLIWKLLLVNLILGVPVIFGGPLESPNRGGGPLRKRSYADHAGKISHVAGGLRSAAGVESVIGGRTRASMRPY